MELKSEVVVKTETKEISSPSIPKLNEDAYESSQANSPNTNEEKDTKIPVQISPYFSYQPYPSYLFHRAFFIKYQI